MKNGTNHFTEEKMSKSTVSAEYMNTLLFEAQKAFWDERGKGARFRFTKLGQAFFDEKVLPQLDDETLEGIISKVHQVLKEEGVIDETEVKVEDNLIRLKMVGCLHRDVGERFAKLGIPPCACLPANYCVHAIDAKLDQQSEIAEVKFEEGHCEALIVVFEK
jgi:hypothetical protein